MTLLQERDAERQRQRLVLFDRTREELRAALGAVLPASRVIVFGSLTKRGVFNAASDLDLALFEEPAGRSIFGLMAVSKKDDVQAVCDGTRCPGSVKDDVDSGKTFGTVSTIGFIVGGVGLIAGAYLFITSAPKTGWNPNQQRTFVGANGLKLSF